MGATTDLVIDWQGVRLQQPREGGSDIWATFKSNRGIFVVRAVDGVYTAIPLSEDDRSSPPAADHTGRGIVLGPQKVQLERIDGKWVGRVTMSGHDIAIEDPRP